MSKDENKPAPAARPQSAGPQTLLMGGVIVIIIAIGVIVWLIASGRGSAPAPANNSAEARPGPQMPNRGRLLPSGLRFEPISEGTGPLVRATDTVLLRYELRVVGRAGVVESTMSDPQPIPLSPAGTVPGFAEALTMMRAGGEARFWVPPNLGYGSQPPPGGPISPDDILEFRVKVERILPAGAAGGAGNQAGAGEGRPEGNSSNVADAATETPAPR